MAPQKITHYSPLILLASIVIFFYPSFIDLVSTWLVWDQSMSHGIPLAAMFIYFLWKSLPWEVSKSSLLVRFLLALILILLSVSWAIFYSIKIKILHELIVLPIFIVSLALVLGVKNVLHYRLLLVLPIYIIPIWDFANEYLVNLSSTVVAALVRVIDMPALIDGNSIQIPSGHIVIADGCSGLRYLIISLCLAHTISYMNGYKEKGLMASLMVAATLGLVTNWIRIFLLIYIGYSTEMKSSLMEDHETFGWVLFAAICFLAIYFAPVVKFNVESCREPQTLTKEVMALWVLTLVILAVGPLMMNSLKVHNIDSKQLFVLDSTYYQKDKETMPSDVVVPKADMNYRLSLANEKIAIQINEYIPQEAGAQLVPYIARTYNQDLWKRLVLKKVTVNHKSANWQILSNKSSGNLVAQIQWFKIGTYQVTSVNEAKFYQILALLKGKFYFAVFTLQAECQAESCNEAEAALIKAASILN